MEDNAYILLKNIENTKNVNNLTVKKVLLLYEENEFFLGDTCLRIESLSHFRTFFKNASIHVNCTDSNIAPAFKDLIANNPNIDGFSHLQWTHLVFEKYDVIFCLSYDESTFLRFLKDYFDSKACQFPKSLSVFSLSESILKSDPIKSVKFPIYTEFLDYVSNKGDDRICKLYIQEEERNWGDNWLLSSGLKEDEDLCLLIDSTTDRSKLIGINAYFELLEYLLSFKQNRILIFDEKNIGKEEFYTAWLGNDKASKIIFAKGSNLRESLKILSSKYIKLVVGPCTGLLHCASSIFNHFTDNGMNSKEVPLMITYTGTYSGDGPRRNAHYWWKNSPLITCLMLRHDQGNVVVAELRELSTDEAKRKDLQAPCSAYTSKMLIDIICSKRPLLRK